MTRNLTWCGPNIPVRISRLILIAALSVSGALAGTITTFYGADDGAGPTDPHTNSDAAAAALGGVSIIDFEGLALGNFTTLTVAPGVNVTLTNNDASGSVGGIQNTDQHTPTPLGYNITAGGVQWLQVVPNFDDATGETVTFDFSIPITVFGAYLTDTQEGFPGPISVSFNDGAPQSLSVTKTSDNGGVLFFGFTDTDPFTSVSLSTGATDGSRDIWGIDNVAFTATPEPGTFGLLAGGVSLILISRIRRNRSL